jgi:diguanylate cyclase (GGDEF)-like protein
MTITSSEPGIAGQSGPENPESSFQFRSPFGDLSSATVMTVDDEPIMTDLIEAYLQEAGYAKIISVNQSERALEVLRREQPSLLLLDLMMPGLSGFDLLRTIRADSQLKFLPVIVLTAANDPANKLKALSYGATDFLAKPVDASELILRVRNSLAFKVYQDHLANTDLVTGLPNRNLMLRRLDGMLQQSKRGGTVFALLHMDLDRFREINDSFGTAVGDDLLRAFGQRLDRCVREGDMVSRLGDRDTTTLACMGGDEFTILLPTLPQATAAENAARRLLRDLAAPFVVGNQEIVLTASIGIATYPGDGDSPDILLANAVSAMSAAKKDGGNQLTFFSPALNARSIERLTLGNQLRRAVERDELRLFFQPKVHIRSGGITGAEALVRWQHPELGLLAPSRFIPLAEDLGLIVAIGEWVLQAACAQCTAWELQGMTGLTMSVNVSQPQFRQRRIVGAVSAALRTHRVPPAQLVLELTESLLIGYGDSVSNTLEELRACGARVSIDDFGTGYSSLSYLKKFPVDELKIDRSFITDLATDGGNAAIVQAIVTLAHSMRMSVVGEGVETTEQLAILAQSGCDEYQGFLCSRPVPADEFARLVRPDPARSGG